MAVRGLEDGGPTTDGVVVMMKMVVVMTAHARAATDT